MSQLDSRKGSTPTEVREAAAAEPALAAELEQLFRRAREQTPPGATATGGGSSDELEGEMARAAATTLHAALLELLRSTEEAPTVWADEAPPPVLSMRAYMLMGSEEPCWGQVMIAPPSLVWTPDATATMAMGTCGLVEGEPTFDVPLARFVGVDDDADEQERHQLRVLQGGLTAVGCLGYLLGHRDVSNAIADERLLYFLRAYFSEVRLRGSEVFVRVRVASLAARSSLAGAGRFARRWGRFARRAGRFAPDGRAPLTARARRRRRRRRRRCW